MSATVQQPLLSAARTAPRGRPAGAGGRGVGLTLVAFALLCAYGVLRWATMLAGAPAWRFGGLVACASAIAALGGATRAQRRWQRAVANTAIVLAALAILPIAGLPSHWFLELKFTAVANAISNGISQLPGVYVPYRGADPWTRAVIVLGAGMLMLGAALTLATSQRRPDASGAPERLRDARLVGAALPLLVLATVPSALARPHYVWLHGAITFALLALFVFSERVPRGRAAGATAFVALAAAVGVLAAPALGVHRPWVSVTTLTSRLGAGGARFDWTQNYGRLNWPEAPSTALTVQASQPYYWKAENLDEFDGRAWVDAPLGLSSAVGTIAPANLERWTQTLTVTLDGITTSQVIGAGLANAPQLPGGISSGGSPGTYVSATPLIPGDRYTITAYTPEPSAAQLAAAGEAYPLSAIGSDLTVELPTGGQRQPQVRFGAYGSGGAIAPDAGESAEQETAALQRSVYGRVYALARRLRAGTTTPYAYASSIEQYLASGYTYDQDPPAASYPLVSFLFESRRGYCQQFAGAMALLLRMGGVPARVAVGFTTGRRVADDTYVVSDFDAHAWVEAWFPSYGWVRFDPTPAADPALGGALPGATANDGFLSLPPAAGAGFGDRQVAGGALTGRHRQDKRRPGSSPALTVAIALAAVALGLVLAGCLALLWSRARAARLDRLEELERALRSCGAPAGDGVTLAMLEARFADDVQAAEYIRRLRRARYAGGGPAPTAGQRRALRHRLARGLGPAGRLRALFALPPLRAARR